MRLACGASGPRPRPISVTPNRRPPTGWQFSLTPYGWMINVNGDVTARGHTVDINQNFFQIVEESDSLLAWMSYFEARKGKLALFTDLVWLDLGFPGSIDVRKSPFARFPQVVVSVKGNAQLDYESTIVQSGFAYEVARWQSAPDSYTALDLVGSARYWNQDLSLSLRLTGTLEADFERLGLKFNRSRRMAIAKSNDLEWVDPVVGARVRHQIASRQRACGSKAISAASAPAANSLGRPSASTASTHKFSECRSTPISVTARFTSITARTASSEGTALTSCSMDQ